MTNEWSGKLTYKSKGTGTISIEDIADSATAEEFAIICARLAKAIGYGHENVLSAFDIQEDQLW